MEHGDEHDNNDHGHDRTDEFAGDAFVAGRLHHASAAEIVPRSGAESSELPIVQKSYSNDNATESGYHKACSQSPVMRTFRKLLINSHFPQKPLQNTMI